MLFVLMLMFVLIFGGSKWLTALFSCTTRVYFIRWLAVPGGKRRYRPAPVWSTIVRLFCLDNCWLLTHDSMRVECVYIRWRPDLACKPVVITKCFIWFYNSSSFLLNWLSTNNSFLNLSAYTMIWNFCKYHQCVDLNRVFRVRRATPVINHHPMNNANICSIQLALFCADQS